MLDHFIKIDVFEQLAVLLSLVEWYWFPGIVLYHFKVDN